ncbi:MAG: hypothetical protein J7M11_06325 [Elusimicrobia bacterium]|nr:hypothetical protein [Elusimicrobiota bacterium]
MTQDDRMDDEIDLGQIFMVLWDKRKLIAFITAGAVIAGIIFAFISPKVYESSSMIMITPSKTEFIKNPLNASLSLDLSGKNKNFGSISIADHLSLLTSGDVSEGIADEINLPELKKENVAGMLFSERIKGSSIIRLTAKGEDPGLCARVANVWAKVYLNKVIGMISGETEASQSFLYSELNKAEAKMVSEEQKLSEFSIKNNVEMKQNELSVKKAKLKNIQSSVIGNEKKLKTKQMRLTALKAEIKKHGQYKRQAKAVTDDALWSRIAEGKGSSALKGKKIYSEEINPIYRKLESEISNVSVEVAFLEKELKYLKAEKAMLHKNVNVLAADVTALKIKKDKISRVYNIAKTRYNSIFSRITEVTIASAAKLGDVKIISKADVPVSPVSPKRKKITAAAAAGGMFAGIMTAFLVVFVEKQQKEIL